jgi:hypothetical protein
MYMCGHGCIFRGAGAEDLAGARRMRQSVSRCSTSNASSSSGRVLFVYVRERARARACVRASERASVRACVRACVGAWVRGTGARVNAHGCVHGPWP